MQFGKQPSLEENMQYMPFWKTCDTYCHRIYKKPACLLIQLVLQLAKWHGQQITH